jgi:hypothetical protein
VILIATPVIALGWYASVPECTDYPYHRLLWGIDRESRKTLMQAQYFEGGHWLGNYTATHGSPGFGFRSQAFFRLILGACRENSLNFAGMP